MYVNICPVKMQSCRRLSHLFIPEQLSHGLGLYHLNSVLSTSFSRRAFRQALKSHLKTNRRIHPPGQPTISKERSGVSASIWEHKDVTGYINAIGERPMETKLLSRR